MTIPPMIVAASGVIKRQTSPRLGDFESLDRRRRHSYCSHMRDHLSASRSHRGRGIGGRLMDEVEARLRSKGCLRCYLFVTADNEKAMRYYEKRGWQLMDNLPYAKDLWP